MAVSFKLTSVASVISVLLLSACNSTSENLTLQQPNLNTNQAIESRLISDYELIKAVSSQIDHSNIYDESMQPVNKKEKCLLPFMVNDGSHTKLYWDGECQDGLAVGLGRAVRTIDEKKTSELLLEIDPQNKDSLVNYLRYDVATQDSEIGYSIISLENNKLVGHSATLGYNDAQWAKGSFEFTYRYEDTTNFVSYTKIIDLLSGDFSSIIAYPNYSHDLLNARDNVLSNIDRTYRLLEGRTMIGLSYIWLKDGRLLIKDNASGQDSIATDHPQELETFVQDLQDKVSAQVEKVNALVERGFDKVEEYSLQKCKRPVAFFKGDEVNQICDYIFNVNASYEQLLEAKELRSHQIDAYRNNQEQRLSEIDRHIKTFKQIKLNQISSANKQQSPALVELGFVVCKEAKVQKSSGPPSR